MTTHPLMQPTLYFLEGLSTASTVGIASYVLIRLLVERPGQIGLFIGAFFAIVMWIPLAIAPETRLTAVGVLVAWTLATFADRAVQPSQESWAETYFKIAVASTCASFLVGALGVWGGFDLSLPDLNNQGFAWGYLMGCLFSPSVSAIFLWMWKTVLLRPGVDRHFYQGEVHK